MMTTMVDKEKVVKESVKIIYDILRAIEPGEQDRNKIYHEIGRAMGQARITLTFLGEGSDYVILGIKK